MVVPEALVSRPSSANDVATKLLASWVKNKNGAADGDVSIRKVALQSLATGLQAVVQEIGEAPTSTQSAPSAGPHDSPVTSLEDVMSILMEDLAKVVFKGLADSTEPCR